MEGEAFWSVNANNLPCWILVCPRRRKDLRTSPTLPISWLMQSSPCAPHLGGTHCPSPSPAAHQPCVWSKVQLSRAPPGRQGAEQCFSENHPSSVCAHSPCWSRSKTVHKFLPQCTKPRQFDSRCTGEKYTGKKKIILLCLDSALICSVVKATQREPGVSADRDWHSSTAFQWSQANVKTAADWVQNTKPQKRFL